MAITILQQPKDFYGKMGEYASFWCIGQQTNLSYTWEFSNNGGATWSNTGYDNNACLSREITATRINYLWRCRISQTGSPDVYSDPAKMVLEDDALMITLQTNRSEPIKVDKDIVDKASLACYLRDSCSLQNPVLLVEAELHDMIDVNYATIPQFGRSYFVAPPVSIRSGLVELTLHVDVLTSFKEKIRANKGIVRRAETDLWNLYINDGSLVAYQDPYILTEPFPYGFTGAGFILAVAGA